MQKGLIWRQKDAKKSIGGDKMKLLIASDIHGSAAYCRDLMLAIEKETPDKVLLLGDLLYHGPRNPLPKEYDPKAVAQMLNTLQGRVLCVRGNCDSEVDQMMLSFPVLSDFALLCWEGKVIYATHGHGYSNRNLPPMTEGELLFCGHTHVPAAERVEGILYCNPGSVSIPKEDSWHGYMVLEGHRLLWKSLEGEIQRTEEV